MELLTQKTTLPFIQGFALQNYSQAENGIIEASKYGYQYWYIDGSISSEVPKKWDSFRIDNMLHLIKQYNIYPIFHGNYKVPLSSDVEELRLAAIQYTKSEIDLASELSAPLIIHGGVVVEPRLVNKVKKEALNHFLSSVDELLNYAIKKNVVIYLENLSNYQNHRPFHYIFTCAEEFGFIFSAIDVKFFLDIGHVNIGNDSPYTIFEEFNHRVVGMSFSNNNGQQDQHLSLRKGTIDYKKIINLIQLVEWKGMVAFETRDVSPAKSINDLVEIYFSNYDSKVNSNKKYLNKYYKTDMN